MGRIGRALRSCVPSARDTAFAVGAGCVVYGCWLIYPPLAFIVAGVALVAIGWILTPRSVPPAKAA